MKILTVISANTPFGGTIAKLRTLILGSKHEHIIYFYCYKQNYNTALSYSDFYRENNIKIEFGVHGRNLFSHSIHISNFAKENNVDVIHFYFNVEHICAPLVKLLCPKVKLVRSFVGYIDIDNLKQLFIKPSIFTVDNYIFISNYIKSKYERDFPILKKKNCRIIYNGPVNVKELSVDCSKKRDLLYVGGLNKSKNTILLPEIINVLVNKYKRSDIKLIIVGDGQMDVIKDLIAKYHIEDNIKLVGYSDNVAPYYENASIYVHPATNEGFGISVVEAMYMHCPCLVSNVSAPQEIVDSTCGYILNPHEPELWAQSIIKLMDNSSLRYRMGEAAYLRAKKIFSIEKFINEHDAFYDNLI